MLADSFLATWLASLLLEAGVAGIVAGYWWIGGALVSAGGAILVRRLRAAGIVSARTAQRLQVAASVLALCVGLFLTRPRRAGFADPIAKDTGGFGSGRYRGVILWTEPKPKEIVMARPPDRGKGHSEKEQNWSIPFDGVYWFFKFPDKQPPAGSYTLSGSPAKTAFRSSDFVALQMVARQNFVNPMEMSCCSRMEVGISNSDEYPPSVLMEVILSDVELPGEPSQSLGRQAVRSVAQRAGESAVQPAHEVVSFAMPEDSKIREFDAATVKFIRTGGRNFASAKMAIEEFTFVPRGR